MDEEIIERFKTFLRFETISAAGPHNGAYVGCVDWLEQRAKEMSFESKRIEYTKNKPLLIISHPGTEPHLPGILLNGHYDVVPVVTEMWDTPPFEAVETDGKIYARGTQDMKSVCMQYLEALGRIKENKIQFKRNIYITFVPDEEIGGEEGIGEFIKDQIKELNIGMALDEGLASETDAYTVFYGERVLWWLKIRSTGPTGHGSRFVPNTATIKLIESIQHFLKFREEQEALLDHHGCKHAVAKKLGDVVTLNLTVLKAGVTSDGGESYSYNVIPMDAEAGFDIRIPPSVPLEEMKAKIEEWTKGEGVSYEFVQYCDEHAVTSIDPNDNPWWSEFTSSAKNIGIELEPAIFPAATDSRYLRQIGIPCFGFSPMTNTPILLHDHNEFIGRDVYLKGIDTYCKLIEAFAKKSEDDFKMIE